MSAPAARAGSPGVAPAVQRLSTGVDSLRSDEQDIHALAAAGIRGSGAALPHLDQIQAAFGHHDISHARAHFDSAAPQRLDTDAYAYGSDIVFRRTPDLYTAAHEAAHVVQQSRGLRPDGGVGRPGDRYERHADAVAERVVKGESAEPMLDQVVGAPNRRSGRGSSSAPARSVQGSGGIAGALVSAAIKAAIFTLEHTPDWMLKPLGPLAVLWKEVGIGYLKRLEKEGGDNLIAIAKNAVSAMTNWAYIKNFALGFLEGFFVDGLAGVFILFYDLGKLAVGAVDFVGRVAKAVGEVGLDDLADMADELSAMGEWLMVNAGDIWDGIKAEINASGGLVGTALNIYEALAAGIKNLARTVGDRIAGAMIEFFSQPVSKLGAKLGKLVGRTSGMITFEVILAVLTAGGGAALTGLKAAAKPLLKLVGKGAKLGIAGVRKVRQGVSALYKGLKGLLARFKKIPAFQKLSSKVESLFDKLIQYLRRVTDKLKGKGKGKGHGEGKGHGDGKGKTKGKSRLDFESLDIPGAMNHVKFRDTNVPRKRGIGGCHDLDEWNKIRQVDDAGWTNPVGKTLDEVPEVIVHSKTPHPNVPGVYKIDYSIPAIDGKAIKGNTTGALRKIKDPKTTYDPKVWTDARLEKSLKEALQDAADKNGGTLPREWSGATSEGFTLRGYFNNGKISSFFFE
ncbi:EndoU domain-containing protein [Haliangium sp.]|uniref:EndoU domain-containing protein n=1 Tax=Haliangium sp. TaxID=2663208 RepID=UPI003D10F725